MDSRHWPTARKGTSREEKKKKHKVKGPIEPFVQQSDIYPMHPLCLKKVLKFHSPVYQKQLMKILAAVKLLIPFNKLERYVNNNVKS